MSRPKRQRNKSRTASTSDWQQLAETPALRDAFLRFAQSVQSAQDRAEVVAPHTGLPPSQAIDLREAGRILDQHPQLSTYLLSIKERQDAVKDAENRPDALLKSSPMTSQTTTSGTWSAYNDATQAQGVNNARILRDFVDQSEWVASAINYYCDRISRADIAVLPNDERMSYNRTTEKTITHLLDNPNEMGDTFPDLLSGFTRDHLTIGRGVITKNMNAHRVPSALYIEDASLIKVYAQWNGNPSQPHYLFQQNTQTKIPLLDDEVICMLCGYSSFRLSFSPVQILRNTILADIKATESASRLVDQKPPPHVIQLPGASATQIKELSTSYTNNIAGRREVLFLGGPNPAQIKPMIYSLKDNQWMEWMEYLVRKIAVVFGLSVQDLSFVGDVNKASAGSQQDISENKGLIPLMLRIESYLNRKLLADFASKKQGRADLDSLNLRIVFPEISESARIMHVEKAIDMATKSLAGMPSMTLNQVLSAQGQESIPGGNVFYCLTANGPVPWLSYDEDMSGLYSLEAVEKGTQDPDGGINSDDTSDDDMSANQGDNKDQLANNQEGASGNVESADSSNDANSSGSQKTYVDTRRPGKAWNSGTDRIRKQQVTTLRKASSPATLPGDKAVRSQLAATVQRIFQDVEQQGVEKLKEIQ